MRRSILFAALACALMAGCSSANRSGYNGNGFAGGNGAFGEDPMQAGAYSYPTDKAPAVQTPTENHSDSSHLNSN